MGHTVWIHEMTAFDVRDYLQDADEVIVPIGSTEVHGPHLPLGVDSFEAIDYSEEIARRAGVLVAAPIWYGDSEHHMHKWGTITLQPETVIAVLKDVYTSLIHHGFRKIITFNGHRIGNLPVINIASRSVKHLHPNVILASMDPLTMTKIHADIRDARGTGLHGCEFETSHMMFKHPELVKEEEVVFAHGYFLRSRFVSVDLLAAGDKMQYYYGPEEQGQIAPLGHIGAADLASPEKGARLFEAIVSAGVEFIEDLRRWVAEGRRIEGATGEEGRELLRREQEWRTHPPSTRESAT